MRTPRKQKKPKKTIKLDMNREVKPIAPAFRPRKKVYRLSREQMKEYDKEKHGSLECFIREMIGLTNPQVIEAIEKAKDEIRKPD